MLAVLAAVAAVVVLDEVGDDDASLATASDQLTVDGLMSVLLTEADLPSGFSEEARGEGEEEAESFLDLFDDIPSDCEESLLWVRERGDERSDEMRVEAEFVRSSDQASIWHSLSPVREGDVTMDELVEAFASCAGPLDVVDEAGSEYTLRVEADRLDNLGEDAMSIAMVTEDHDLGVTFESYDITVARGGVYSTVSMGSGIDRATMEPGTVDRDLVRDLTETVDARIQQGMEEG